jgi:hypothetical protein
LGGDTAPVPDEGTIEVMTNDNGHPRVWLLWDCVDLISIHATEEGTEAACAKHTAMVSADLGARWAASHHLHIAVSWIEVHD